MRAVYFCLLLAWAPGAYALSGSDQARIDVGTAYLDLANKLSQVRNSGYVCETDAYHTEILGVLNKAQTYLGGEFSNAYRRLPDIQRALQSNIMLRALLNKWSAQDLQDVDNFARILPDSTFYSIGGGALGPVQTLHFQLNRTVKSVRRLGVDANGDLIVREAMGTWRVHRVLSSDGSSRLTLIVELEGQKIVFKIDSVWAELSLIEDAPAGTQGRRFVSTPSDCEA